MLRTRYAELEAEEKAAAKALARKEGDAKRSAGKPQKEKFVKTQFGRGVFSDLDLGSLQYDLHPSHYVSNGMLFVPDNRITYDMLKYAVTSQTPDLLSIPHEISLVQNEVRMTLNFPPSDKDHPGIVMPKAWRKLVYESLPLMFVPKQEEGQPALGPKTYDWVISLWNAHKRSRKPEHKLALEGVFSHIKEGVPPRKAFERGGLTRVGSYALSAAVREGKERWSGPAWDVYFRTLPRARSVVDRALHAIMEEQFVSKNTHQMNYLQLVDILLRDYAIATLISGYFVGFADTAAARMYNNLIQSAHAKIRSSIAANAFAMNSQRTTGVNFQLLARQNRELLEDYKKNVLDFTPNLASEGDNLSRRGMERTVDPHVELLAKNYPKHKFTEAIEKTAFAVDRFLLQDLRAPTAAAASLQRMPDELQLHVAIETRGSESTSKALDQVLDRVLIANSPHLIAHTPEEFAENLRKHVTTTPAASVLPRIGLSRDQFEHYKTLQGSSLTVSGSDSHSRLAQVYERIAAGTDPLEGFTPDERAMASEFLAGPKAVPQLADRTSLVKLDKQQNLSRNLNDLLTPLSEDYVAIPVDDTYMFVEVSKLTYGNFSQLPPKQKAAVIQRFQASNPALIKTREDHDRLSLLNPGLQSYAEVPLRVHPHSILGSNPSSRQRFLANRARHLVNAEASARANQQQSSSSSLTQGDARHLAVNDGPALSRSLEKPDHLRRTPRESAQPRF